eukprot:TRINITY_DN4317_c0_g1_i10.p1 TRINITY_DN4317_c0_g1~~TRINITY_DN4317_c0_g1_i10.p1  ORF type:complete len:538 (-),score=126.98 TRINITY_DN4317_c0_g1_i10:911-2524(-)
MLKTSRSRALDTGRPLPVYNEENIQDVDIQPVRGLQYVVTGMEKAEEDEKHLQEILTAQVLGLQKHQEDLIIPTPEYSTISDYDQIYQGNARKHTQYIHALPFFHEDYPAYDMDEDDARFIKEEVNDRWKLELSPTNFEQMISQLETNSGSSTITLEEAKLILKEDDDLILLVYEYWLKKKLQQEHNLIPSVRSEKVGCNADKRNPYVAFRRRFEKMQTRKNRKLDENNYIMMLKLRRDLSRVVTLLSFLKKRERLKKAGLELDLDIAERRISLTDWDSRIINEIHASRKYKKLEEYALRQEEGLVSEDDISTVDSDYESADEGPFQFRRKEGVEYLAPLDWSSSNEEPEDLSTVDTTTMLFQNNHENNKYIWTYIPEISVSYARRRVGRGGRVVIDRAPPCKRIRQSTDDFTDDEGLSLMDSPSPSYGIVYPALTPDLKFVDWDPYRSEGTRDESEEVSSIMCNNNSRPASGNGNGNHRTTPHSPWRRQRYLSGGSMKTINMNKVGAHNAASAVLNNQFIDLFSLNSNNTSSTNTN